MVLCLPRSPLTLDAMGISKRSARVLAPAKINLMLRVVGRRTAGYHLLETLMVPTSWCDEIDIRVEPTSTGRSKVSCRSSGRERVEPGASNLAAKAASVLLVELDAAAEVTIYLDKRIPVGAGLGGGSSDAAAVLRVLPRLLGRRIERERLHELATTLGADVPFFLDCRAAWASGIGDVLAPIPAFPRLDLVIVVPEQRVATAWAYANALPPIAEIAKRVRSGNPHRFLHPTVKC